MSKRCFDLPAGRHGTRTYENPRLHRDSDQTRRLMYIGERNYDGTSNIVQKREVNVRIY